MSCSYSSILMEVFNFISRSKHKNGCRNFLEIWKFLITNGIKRKFFFCCQFRPLVRVEKKFSVYLLLFRVSCRPFNCCVHSSNIINANSRVSSNGKISATVKVHRNKINLENWKQKEEKSEKYFCRCVVKILRYCNWR